MTQTKGSVSFSRTQSWWCCSTPYVCTLTLLYHVLFILLVDVDGHFILPSGLTTYSAQHHRRSWRGWSTTKGRRWDRMALILKILYTWNVRSFTTTQQVFRRSYGIPCSIHSVVAFQTQSWSSCSSPRHLLLPYGYQIASFRIIDH